MHMELEHNLLQLRIFFYTSKHNMGVLISTLKLIMLIWDTFFKGSMAELLKLNMNPAALNKLPAPHLPSASY